MTTVAVIGGGVSGLTAARLLSQAGMSVVLYEKEELGGKARTVTADGNSVDLGCILYNGPICPEQMNLFEICGLDLEVCDMSFSVSLDKGRGYEWGNRNGLLSLFAQKKNVFNPYFLSMIGEVAKFKNDIYDYLEDLDSNPDIDRNETLSHFIRSRGYSELFQKMYLVPICASIWPCSSELVMNFSIYSVLSFLRDHHFLQCASQILDYPQCLVAKPRSQDYVKQVRDVLESRGCQIRTNSEVCYVSSNDDGCTIRCKDGSEGKYDDCIIAVRAPEAVNLLGDQATSEELRILGAFQYANSDAFFHRDKTLMPKTEAAWSARNFLGSSDYKGCVTYWVNILQNIKQEGLPFLLSLNPPHTPEHTILKWSTEHPIPSVAASKAFSQISLIQGKRRIWFCGSYQGYGFHEDGIKAGILAANDLLGRSSTLQISRKHIVPSWLETGARLLVTQFFRRFIATGCIIFLESGGTTFAFEGRKKTCLLKVTVIIHSPQFYWKVATEADLGLADAYIDGDFSFVDKDEGLLNFFLILEANNALNAPTYKGGWWRPLLFTSAISSAKYFLKHALRRNTLTQARRNISRHYDLSNELFSLFLDETMTYSCAVFKSSGEDLKAAQLRKLSLLIEKAKISKNHHVLDIGSGWGTLAIEVVKRTGCKCTGITLSEEQLKYAQDKAKEAGLQDHVKFVLCDYRQLPKTEKYDRIISCGMIEHVGHEQVEEFFRCCDSSLAENGILVLQFISIPDYKYDEYKHSPGFIREYIFPGGCVLSLNRVTSAMAAASRLCVQHVEEIGIHYYTTLRCWRMNFLKNKIQIHDLGFDDKFMRTWEYYFDYCAAGFRTRSVGDYQIVFSRAVNDQAFGAP